MSLTSAIYLALAAVSVGTLVSIKTKLTITANGIAIIATAYVAWMSASEDDKMRAAGEELAAMIQTGQDDAS